MRIYMHLNLLVSRPTVHSHSTVNVLQRQVTVPGSSGLSGEHRTRVGLTTATRLRVACGPMASKESSPSACERVLLVCSGVVSRQGENQQAEEPQGEEPTAMLMRVGHILGGRQLAVGHVEEVATPG